MQQNETSMFTFIALTLLLHLKPYLLPIKCNVGGIPPQELVLKGVYTNL